MTKSVFWWPKQMEQTHEGRTREKAGGTPFFPRAFSTTCNVRRLTRIQAKQHCDNLLSGGSIERWAVSEGGSFIEYLRLKGCDDWGPNDFDINTNSFWPSFHGILRSEASQDLVVPLKTVTRLEQIGKVSNLNVIHWLNIKGLRSLASRGSWFCHLTCSYWLSYRDSIDSYTSQKKFTCVMITPTNLQ